MQKLVSIMLKVVAPLAFAVAVLWWMYRGFPWDELMQAVRSDMRWEWMWLSFPFGISAQAFRALRWRQVLAPMGLRPRLSTCLHAVFFSYFSSLVVPRSGEVLRCGVLHRYEGISFSRGVGSVVTERVVDMSMVALFSLATVLTQLPVFIRFLGETGLSLSGFLQGFTATGYLVTAVCLAFIVITGIELKDAKFAERINQPYLNGFAGLKIMQSSSFDANSAANLYRQAHGLNMQGSEIVRPSMWANRYPFEECYNLFGALAGCGAQ